MNDYISATLLSLEEKINYLDYDDRRLLDEIANHLLMTHELLQNHRDCSHTFHLAPEARPGQSEAPDYLGNHH